MVKLQEKYGLFINGEFVPASSGKTLDTFDPATGKKLAAIADASKEDVDEAVKAAREAFKTFRHSTVSERSRILLKIADIIDANKDFLATVETMDNGKPIRETLNVDVPYAAEHFRYFAGVIQGEEGSANVLEEKAPLTHLARAYRRRSTDRAVEFPVFDGGMEASSGHRSRRHERAKTVV